MTPALRFNHAPFHPNDLGNIVLRFREKGFATIGGAFDAESVDAYLSQVNAAVQKGPAWWMPFVMDMSSPLAIWPAKAPRLREVLRSAFMPFIDRPWPVLFHPTWLIRPSNPDEKLVHDWHKDGDHSGATSVHGYTYPPVIHAAMYFTDMTPAHGPTYVIPGSHRDPRLTPFGGRPSAEEPFLCGKGDIIIWDQRLWHRASARTVEGLRIVAIFAFGSTYTGDKPLTLTECQKQALRDAAEPSEKILFGGGFEHTA